MPDAEAYQLTLRHAEAANRLESDNGSFVISPSVAQCRISACGQAAETLIRSQELHSKAIEGSAFPHASRFWL